MSANNLASVPVEMAGFPVFKNAEAAFENQPKPLQEWLECQDFMLAAQAHQIGWLPVNADSLQHFKAFAQDAFSVSHFMNDTITQEMGAAFSFAFKASAILESAGEKIADKTKSPLDTLREVKPEDKRKVLRYAQIIPTAMAAAYIGVSEHALNDWNKYRQAFGANYAGGHCYSLEELKMIANNRVWIYSEVVADEVRVTAPDDEKSLDEVVMVDKAIASAFTDMSYDELYQQLPRNQLAKRPYRLSDLEKIRVAKLTAQQH